MAEEHTKTGGRAVPPLKIVVVDTNTLTAGDIDFSPIERLGQVTFYDRLTPEELMTAAEFADILLINKAEITRQLAEHCKNLKYVGTFSTGYNNVDLSALKERGIPCCNVPGYSTQAVCQHVFAMLLMLEGNTDKYAASVQSGDWVKSRSFCYMPWAMHELSCKTFGVYGYGSIGRAVAKVADAFGMNVVVHTRTTPIDCHYQLVGGDEIFAVSDYLSLHCPLNGATAGVVNGRTLSLMKPSAVLINTARGGLVDEVALAAALNGGRLRAACLDVLTEEPMNADCALRTAKNCLITPHIAWCPRETRARLVELVAENLSAFLAGRPQNVVNR